MRRLVIAAIGMVLGLTACVSLKPADDYPPRHTAKPRKIATGPWRRVAEARWGGTLRSVVAVGSDEAWAVGSADEDGSAVMHLTQGVWLNVDIPHSLGVGALNAVAVPARGDVWVFGGLAADDQAIELRALRWDGSTWSLAWREPGAVADAAVAAGPDDVWMAGHPYRQSGACQGGFLKHRVGTGWRTTSLPSGVCVHRMSALSPSDVWAVGDSRVRPVALHWDGRTWTVTPLPVTAQRRGTLTGIAAVSPTEVWAVGADGSEKDRPKDRAPIAVRWDGHQWAGVGLDGVHTAFYRVVSDGHGGILVSSLPGDTMTIFRNDGQVWTRELLYDGWIEDVALVEGTSQTIAVGACCDGWDEDITGRIWLRS